MASRDPCAYSGSEAKCPSPNRCCEFSGLVGEVPLHNNLSEVKYLGLTKAEKGRFTGKDVCWITNI